MSIYRSLWRSLPGARAAKAVQAVAIVLLAVLALFWWGFPWLQDHLPGSDVTLPGGTR